MEVSMDLLSKIEEIVNLSSNSEIDQLQLKEEILVRMLKSDKVPRRSKLKFLKEVEAINRKQLSILGHSRT